jgi:hypothetical protein
MAKVWRVEVVGDTPTSGLAWMFTLHYQTDMGGASGEPPASRIIDEFFDHWGSTGTNLSVIAAALASPNTLRAVRAREEVDPTGDDVPEQAERAIGIPGTLTISGDHLPIEACMWMKCGTGVASRSSRGGFHWPPTLAPAFLDSSGFWDAASLGASPFSAIPPKVIDVLNDVFPEEIGNGSLKPVIYSKTRRARGQSPYTFQITTAAWRQHVAWLRRRGIAP